MKKKKKKKYPKYCRGRKGCTKISWEDMTGKTFETLKAVA